MHGLRVPRVMAFAFSTAMTDEPRRKQVTRPILRLHVLGSGGRAPPALRVYCRERAAPVPVGECRGCASCDEIVDEPRPAVRCRVSAARADLPVDPLGLVTPVAEVLTPATFAMRMDVTVADALAHLRRMDRRSAAVVDDENAVVGVVHEADRDDLPELPVGAVMRSRLALPLETSVRRALALMAAGHLREIVVVDAESVPLGTFRDVDGLLWLAAARRR